VIAAAGARTDYNDEREKTVTLAYLKNARSKFQALTAAAEASLQ